MMAPMRAARNQQCCFFSSCEAERFTLDEA
jgi:hypothetical protein